MRYHTDGRPIIGCHEDVFEYLVPSKEFKLEEATAFLLFEKNLKVKVSDREITTGKKFNHLDIDNYIDSTYGVSDLEDFKQKAAETLASYNNNLKILHINDELPNVLKDIPKKKGFWASVGSSSLSGFCGNVFTIVIFFCFTFIVAASQDSSSLASRTIQRLGCLVGSESLQKQELNGLPNQ